VNFRGASADCELEFDPGEHRLKDASMAARSLASPMASDDVVGFAAAHATALLFLFGANAMNAVFGA
jgi:hypothetical protein